MLSHANTAIQHLAFQSLLAWKVKGLTENPALVQRLISTTNRFQVYDLELPDEPVQRKAVVEALSHIFYGKLIHAHLDKDLKKKVFEHKACL